MRLSSFFPSYAPWITFGTSLQSLKHTGEMERSTWLQMLYRKSQILTHMYDMPRVCFTHQQKTILSNKAKVELINILDR